MQFQLRRGKALQTGITICCLLAFVLFGYDQGVFSGALQSNDWQQQFGYPSDSKTGIIVSCYNLGCLSGCVGESGPVESFKNMPPNLYISQFLRRGEAW